MLYAYVYGACIFVDMHTGQLAPSLYYKPIGVDLKNVLCPYLFSSLHPLFPYLVPFIYISLFR